MANIDESILKKKQAIEEFEKQRFSKETVEEENKQSIFNKEITINSIPVKFSARKLLDNQIEIWMPEDFEGLPPEAIAAIYLLGNKPDLVFGNSYLNFSIGFRYTEHEIPNEYMGDMLSIVKLTLERTGPKVRILSEKKRQVGKHMVSSLQLISHTVTDAVYNIMFFCSLQGRMLMGFINFNYKYRERYIPIAEEILQSFHIVEDEGESEGE